MVPFSKNSEIRNPFAKNSEIGNPFSKNSENRKVSTGMGGFYSGWVGKQSW